MNHQHNAFLSEYDYESLDKTLTVYAGGFAPLDFFSLQSYLDGVRENLEGYVLYLEIIEADLDPRDAGQVSLARSVYLVRINQSGKLSFFFPESLISMYTDS